MSWSIFCVSIELKKHERNFSCKFLFFKMKTSYYLYLTNKHTHNKCLTPFHCKYKYNLFRLFFSQNLDMYRLASGSWIYELATLYHLWTKRNLIYIYFLICQLEHLINIENKSIFSNEKSISTGYAVRALPTLSSKVRGRLHEASWPAGPFRYISFVFLTFWLHGNWASPLCRDPSCCIPGQLG